MNISFSAIAYMAPIRQYAMANGLKFFTWKDQRKALARYELFQSKLN